MYNSFNIALGLLLVLIFQLCGSNAASDVVTQNLKMYVDGQEFFIKALCYSPAPLGQGVGVGGGFCSPKTTPFGGVQTACYDSDYFDGGGDGAGRPQPTQGGWFQPIWERDFPIMKSLGANTLRLYSTNPTTKQASIYYPEIVSLPLGKDHVPFMDMAQAYGFKIIFPLISDYGMMTSYSISTFKRLLRWQVDEIGNHPALLMWAFGNELPLDGNQALINTVNMYITYVKQYTYTKWGRRVPVTTAVVDLPQSYDYLAANLDVDVFTTNAGYRGVTFTDLWSGSAQTQGWHKLSCRYSKPVFIGEMGWLSLSSAINTQIPNWFNQMWKDLVAHIDQGCIGGAFFEYNDEGLKADALQQTMGLVQFQVNNTGGLLSTAAGVWNADIATPKNIIFDAVKSGSYNGAFYNMNSSPFYLAGRSPTLLGSSSTDICSTFGFKTCPAQNTCSFKGICDRQSGLCTCDAGWTGADCSQAICTSGCSGFGTCVNSVSPPVCACQAGRTGPSCAVTATQATCATYCASGNGNCDVNGNCVCNRGWWGHDCGIPDISYPPIGTPNTPQPTVAPTTPSVAPTKLPSQPPTTPPTISPTSKPPTQSPTVSPTGQPTSPPTSAPTSPPTSQPTGQPTIKPTVPLTQQPTPTAKLTSAPTAKPPTISPTAQPTGQPTSQPTIKPTLPTGQPTSQPTGQPTSQPTGQPTSQPTGQPTSQPTSQPTIKPTQQPTQSATTAPSICGTTMQSCGAACFNPQMYSCYDGWLCPIPTLRCGNACYDTTLYNCNNNQLIPK